MIWSGVILGGLLATCFGFGALDADAAEAGFAASSATPVPLVMLLLTGGLASCLAGLLGLSGLMAWIPGLDQNAEALARPE
ncbi:MAG TPA: hypothetical protein DCW29_10075 [Janthinobacterium sp.]|nr:hypothetical protein [Janthinobacterium sp.]